MALLVLRGPKWCGKTWTGLKHSNSVMYLTEPNVRDLAEANPKYIFDNNRPELLDEWQLVPTIWDKVSITDMLNNTIVGKVELNLIAKFMCIIVGYYEAIVKERDRYIYYSYYFFKTIIRLEDIYE